MTLSCLKHMNCIICVYEESDASRCLLQDMQHGFVLAGVFAKTSRSSAKSTSIIISAGYRLSLDFLM